MPKFKNIRIPKRGGGTRLQRVQVLKSGKFKFVKNLSRKVKRATTRKTKTPKKRKSNPKRGNPSMARKKGFDSRKVFAILKPIALIGPAVEALLDPFKTGRSREDRAGIFFARYFGYDPIHPGEGFQGHRLLEGYGPFIVATAVPKVAAAINKMFGMFS